MSLEHRRCVELLADDPSREKLRVDLEARKKCLAAGQKCIQDLQNKYVDSGSISMEGHVDMHKTSTVHHLDAAADVNREMFCDEEI